MEKEPTASSTINHSEVTTQGNGFQICAYFVPYTTKNQFSFAVSTTGISGRIKRFSSVRTIARKKSQEFQSIYSAPTCVEHFGADETIPSTSSAGGRARAQARRRSTRGGQDQNLVGKSLLLALSHRIWHRGSRSWLQQGGFIQHWRRV